MHTITQTVSCQPPAPSPHGLGQDAFTTPLKAIAICALKHADVRIPPSLISLHRPQICKQAVKSNYLHVFEGTLPSVLHRNSS